MSDDKSRKNNDQVMESELVTRRERKGLKKGDGELTTQCVKKGITCKDFEDIRTLCVADMNWEDKCILPEQAKRADNDRGAVDRSKRGPPERARHDRTAEELMLKPIRICPD